MAPYRRRLGPGTGGPDDPVEAELDEEIAAHLDMRTRELVDSGMAPDEARAEARRRFGRGDARRVLLKEARRTRRSRRLRAAVDALVTDTRLAWRHALRAPGFALVALAIFAGGVGLTTATFTVADHVLLRPLPFPEAERLVALWSVAEEGGEFPWISMGNWVDWKESSSTLESTAFYATHQASVAAGDDAFYAATTRAGGAFFATLDPSFVLGRPFTEEEAQAVAPLAVVGEGFWRRVMGGARDLSDAELTVDGTLVRVVGVLEGEHAFPGGTEIWLPRPYRPAAGSMRNNINFQAVARLKEDVTLAGARADLDGVAAGIRATDPEGIYSWGVGVRPLRDVVVGGARTQLVLLAASVGLLLLVACANLAGLSLARARRRDREIAVHLALGSGRWRLVRRVVTDHLLLALLGGSLGVLLARFAADALLGRAATLIPRAHEVGFDARVAAFGIAVSLAAGLLAGLVPALRTGGGDLSAFLSGARGGITGGRGLPGAFMVGTEIALAVSLLVGGGLLLRSLQTLVDRELGIDPGNVVTAEVALVGSAYKEDGARLRYWDAVLERVRGLPGVVEAAASNAIPTSDGGRGFIDLPDRIDENIGADYRVVSEGYFRTLGIPVLSGRVFDASDGPGTERVTVVSESLARRYWPGESPLGRRIRARSMESYLFGGEAPWLTVVGVVGDVRQYGFESGWREDMYTLLPQVPYYSRGMTLVAKGRDGSAATSAAVRDALRQVDPTLAVELGSMEGRLADLTEERRLVLAGLGLFGGASLLLVCLGIYGLMSYAASARTREMAVRVALGARATSIVGLMLGSALRVVAAGAVAGLLLAYAFTHLLQGFLVEVGAADPLTYGAALGFLVLVAVGAALTPSLRAAGRDPLEGLASE